MAKRYKNAWTPEEDALLKKCVSDGMINKEIAPLLPKRGFQAVSSRRRQLGLKGPVVTFPQDDPATVAQIVKFRMAGWRLEDIEAVSGVSQTRLSWLVLRAGIRVKPVIRMPNPQKHRWTVTELDRLRRCLRRKMPFASLCREFPNRTERAIYKKMYLLKRDEVSVDRQERWRAEVVVKRSMSIQEMRDQELTIDEIAEITDKTRVEVYRALGTCTSV